MVIAYLLRKTVLFQKINFKFATTVNSNKCLKQIKLPILLFECASISELPSDLGTRIMPLMFFTVVHLHIQISNYGLNLDIERQREI